MLATALLSMWISNTATAVMMLPIAMALVGQFGSGHSKRDFGQSLMLGIAYSASIGGIATLIGTPTNLVLAGVVEELYGHHIAFSEWFIFGLPIAVILLAIAWFLPRKGSLFAEKRSNWVPEPRRSAGNKVCLVP